MDFVLCIMRIGPELPVVPDHEFGILIFRAAFAPKDCKRKYGKYV